MERMNGRGRSTVTALVASLALLATLPAPCLCISAAAVTEHSCCAPPPGVRAVDPGCCAAPELLPETPAATPVSKALAPAAVAATWLMPTARLALDRRVVSPDSTVSSPPTVRRL